MKLITLLFVSFFSTFLTAQSNYHVNISGSISLWLRTDLQLEIPVSHNASLGLKLRNHRIGSVPSQGSDGYSVVSSEPLFLVYRGNTLEAFGRRYFNRDLMNEREKWFGQAKIGFGHYQNPLFSHEEDFLTKQNYANQTFNTFGGGVGVGFKQIFFKHFTFEVYGGLRFYTPPTFTRADNFNPLNYYGEEEFARNSWFISRSFPIELNCKIGFQL